MDSGNAMQNFSSLILEVDDDTILKSNQRQEHTYLQSRKCSTKFIKIGSFIAGIITALLLTTIVITLNHSHKKEVYTDDSKNVPNAPVDSTDLGGHLVVRTEKNLWILNPANNNHFTIEINASTDMDYLFEYDYHNKTIIWIDKSSNELKSLSQDYPIERFSKKLMPETFRMDHITGNFYVLDNMAETVSVIDVKTGLCGILISQITNPSDLVLDPSEGVMFIASKYHSISRLDMNGNNLEVIVKNSGVSALAIDRTIKTLYFALDFKSIESVNYRGRAAETITKVSTVITSLTILNQSLYWTEDSNALRVCEIEKETYGHRCKNVSRAAAYLPVKNPKTARAYEQLPRIAHVSNPCKGECQHLCLLAPDVENSRSAAVKYSCACAIGWQLERDGKSCSPVVDYLLYALGNTIRARNLEAEQHSFVDVIYPTEFHAEPLKLKHAIDFDYDIRADRLFFSDDHNIYVMSIKSQVVEQKRLVHVDDNFSINDVTFDWLSGYLYYVKMSMTSSYNHSIVALRYTDKLLLETTVQNLLYESFSMTNNRPYSLIVLPEANSLFYTAYDGSKDIQMFSVIQTSTTPLQYLPYFNQRRTLAIDYAEAKLYFLSDIIESNNTSEISCINYDGSNKLLRFVTQVPHIVSMYVYQQWLFISNEIGIWRLDKTNGSGITPIIKNSDSHHTLSGMRIISPTIQIINANENSCAFNNGGCKQFCFSTVATKECRCSDDTPADIRHYC